MNAELKKEIKYYLYMVAFSIIFTLFIVLAYTFFEHPLFEKAAVDSVELTFDFMFNIPIYYFGFKYWIMRE
jgi:hypothetical protein